jgi:hypothetical protein
MDGRLLSESPHPIAKPLSGAARDAALVAVEVNISFNLLLSKT